MKIRNDSSIPLTARLLAGVVLLNLVIYSIAAFSLYKSAEKHASDTITSTQNRSQSISSIISAIPDKADVLLMAMLFTLFSSMMVWRVHRKLTEELQAADALRLSEERFRELVENAPIGVYRRDISGEYHYINPAMLRAFHCKSEEEFKARYGSVSQRWAHPEKNIEYNELLRKEGKVTNYEVESCLDDGTAICTLLSSILDESGRIIDGWALDITRKKQSDEELERYRKHLEELVSRRTAQLEGALEGAKSADKAKSQFLANMSHEIRTPMNAVMGMTHLALQGELSPGQRGYLKKVLSAAESLMVIINDILDISKIEAGKLEIELADFRTEELVERVTTITAVKAVEKGLDFRVFLDPAIPPVLIGDPLRIAQVLINLCGNAVKFTESGLVKLKIEMLQRMDEEKLLLRFSVEDTGIGITEEQISRLFSPFSQADATTSRRFGGTGLGLAICKQLVEIMGGEIEVSSTPGKGSDFSFCLPLAAGKADIIPVHDIAADTYEFRQLHNNPHLLLVEDNEFNQQVATELLKQSGCRVTLADNGIDALEKLPQNRL